jgi:hypothetical protein
MRTFSRDLNEHIQSEKRAAGADGKNTALAPKQSRARLCGLYRYENCAIKHEDFTKNANRLRELSCISW